MSGGAVGSVHGAVAHVRAAVAGELAVLSLELVVVRYLKRKTKKKKKKKGKMYQQGDKCKRQTFPRDKHGQTIRKNERRDINNGKKRRGGHLIRVYNNWGR